MTPLFLSKSVYFSGVDLPRVLKVGLVSSYHEYYVLWAILTELLHPLFHLLEALLGGNVVHYYGSGGIFIVKRRHRVELFLTGSVLCVIRGTQIAS